MGGSRDRSSEKDRSSALVGELPRPRSSSATGSGVDTDWSGELALTPFNRRFAGVFNFVFWTWAAGAASLNAVGVVAGAGVSAIFGFVCVPFSMVFFGICSLGVGSFGMGFFDEAPRVDGIIDGNENDAGAVAGNDTGGSDALAGIGKWPKRDFVRVSGVVVATPGLVVTAATGGRGTI